MSIDTATLAEFNEKDVILVLSANPDEQIEGAVAGASPVGIAFKRKGKRDLELIEPSAVESLTIAPKKPTTIKQKKQLPVPVDRVRSHLANNHGIEVAWLNAATNEDAEAFHNSIDHGPLAHNHEKVEGETDAADETPEDGTDSE